MSKALSSKQLATCAADLAAERKASDIVLLELGQECSVADYFVVCTGRSDVQVQSICERIQQGLSLQDQSPLSTEGISHGLWALIDYGDVVVHVFQDSARTLYDLERLWGEAPRRSWQGPGAS